MEMIEQAYGMFLTAAVLVLAALIICSVIRSVLGPGIADRILAVNMTGTMIIMIIAVLSLYLDESYLADICLIYAMISFLGVVVLCKVYTGVYLQRKGIRADMGAIESNLAEQGLCASDAAEIWEREAESDQDKPEESQSSSVGTEEKGEVGS